MSDAIDKSPWYGTAEEGLLWILRDETCKTEQVELVAEKALEKIEALLSLSADKDREIESLQRENEELKRYVNEAERLFRMYGLSSPPRKGHEWPNTGGMGDE